MIEWSEFARHISRDILFLLAIGVFPALAMYNPRISKSFTASLIGVWGLALIVVAGAHIKLLGALVALDEYGWIHKLTLAVIFGVLSLPVAWAVSRKKIKAGWVVALSAILWVVIIAQILSITVLKTGLGGDVVLRQYLNNINRAIESKDATSLAQTIESIEIPKDTSQFDMIIIPILKEALSYKSPAVVRAAIKKLGQRGDPSAIPDLLKTINDASPEMRPEVEKAINELASQPESSQILENLLFASDGDMRRKAFAFLMKNHPEEIEKIFPSLLAGGNAEIQQIIAQTVGSGSGAIKNAKILDMLFAALKSDNVDISGAAAATLTALADLPQVQKRLDPNYLIRILDRGKAAYKPAAAQLLKKISAAKAVPALIAAAKSTDLSTAYEATAALVAMAAPDATDVFAAAVSSTNPSMRYLGYEGLRAVLPRNTPADNPIVQKLLSASKTEKDLRCKRILAELLVWLDLTGAYEYAEILLSSYGNDSAVKLSVIAAFDLSADQRSFASLMKLAHDSDPEVKTAALQVIGHVGDSSFLPELKKIGETSDPSVREAANEAVAEISKRVNIPITTPPPAPNPFSDEESQPPQPKPRALPKTP